jgi:hypothetical protein
MLRYNHCRCCDSNDLKPWLSLPNSPVANALFKEPDFERHPLELNHCQNCGHLQLSSAPDPDGVFADYKYKSGVSASFRKHFKEYAKTITKEYGAGKVLEIGSNDGYLLQQFKELGCSVIGVEPSLNLSQDHIDKGVPVVASFFTTKLIDTMYWKDSFDYIIGNNVLMGKYVTITDNSHGRCVDLNEFLLPPAMREVWSQRMISKNKTAGFMSEVT